MICTTDLRVFFATAVFVAVFITAAPTLSACNDGQAATRPVGESSDAVGIQGMVLIPGGEFVMGKDGDADYSPAHTVTVKSFYMDQYELTNAEYFEFCKATGHALPEFWGMEEFHSGSDFPNYPVTGVSWVDAKAYAEWAGKRLPTEAEWEYAARGGLVGMNYPTGDEPDPKAANFKSQGTLPVGSFPPNGYGLYDMAGNANEWVSDVYDPEYYQVSPTDNPTGPEKGRYKVIRGGGWRSGPFCNRVYFRNGLPQGWVDFNLTIRCVRDVE